MVLNIHPMFVHIPVAFLTIYSLFEMIKWKKITEKYFWCYIKGVLLSVGVLGAFAALQTGELAGELYKTSPIKKLVETHATFAAITTYYFTIILILYISKFVQGHFKNKNIEKTVKFLNKVYVFLIESWLSILLGSIGFILISITGALGGAIVYGSEIDPVVSFIYHLFL